MPRLHLRSAALVALSLTACATDDDGNDEGGNEPRVTFYDDALPVLNEHCVTCHTEGGLAPFCLDTYEDAKEWSAAVVMQTTERTMPPFGVNNDGSCNKFQH